MRSLDLGGIWVGRPVEARLNALLESAVDAAPSYDHVGSTLGGPGATPRLRHHDRVVGQGSAAFSEVVDALQTWVPQRGLGARILPAGIEVAVGATLLVVLPAGPVTMIAPNRVVAVVDEPTRWGFAYGSLPGHPERGEESFVAEHRSDGSVTVRITVDAAPATWVTRIGSPVTMAVQRRAVERYLDALVASVAGRDQPAT